MNDMEEILDFWFAEDVKPLWFAPTPEFDEAIRRRFGELSARAAAGELKSWQDIPEGCLALCLLLDQTPPTCSAARLRPTRPTTKPARWQCGPSTWASIEASRPISSSSCICRSHTASAWPISDAPCSCSKPPASTRRPSAMCRPFLGHPPVRALSPSQRHSRAGEHPRRARVSGAASAGLWPERAARSPEPVQGRDDGAG
jgi:Bacterial protein of unknown function (DUF924)